MTKIYSGLVGTHARPIDHTITGQVLPVNLASDYADLLEMLCRGEHITPRKYLDAVIRAINEPNKLAYIGGSDPAKFMGMVTLQDAGLLTRNCPLDIRWLAPYQRWRANGRTLDAYIERIREVCTELAVALRMVLPNARLVACEAFDITSLTATSDADPHPAMRRRWRQFRETCKVWEHWETATSIYPNDESVEMIQDWADQMDNETIAFVTPIANGQLTTPERFAETLRILTEPVNPHFYGAGPRARDVVIWGNPKSEDDARQHADIASAAVRLAANPTVNPQ